MPDISDYDSDSEQVNSNQPYHINNNNIATQQQTNVKSLFNILHSNPSYTSSAGPLIISLTTLSLAVICTTSLFVSLHYNVYSITVRQFTFYTFSLSLFHLLEFYLQSLFHPNTGANAFLLNHSKQYKYAIAAAVIEYWLESMLCYTFGINDNIKHNRLLITIGLIGVVIGQLIRSVSMYQCGYSFTHLIVTHKTQQHKLITSGLYSIVRHPSYSGWFILVVSQQILLCNPICTIVYIYVSYRFFKQRIIYEEMTLFSLYGNQYEQYCKTVKHTGVLFVDTSNILDDDNND